MGIWPRAGTVSVANGSNVVTGDLTIWGASVQPGNAIFIDGGNYPYEIDHLDDTTPNTKLYLVEEYAGASVAGAPYKIIPFFGDRTPMAVATLVAQQRLVASQTDVIETSGAPDPSISPGNISGKSLAFDPEASAYYRKKDDGTWDGPISLGGQDAGFHFTFSSTVAMAAPGTGTIRLNNANPALATAIAIDDTSADSGNPDVSAFVLGLDDSTNTTNKGTLTLRKQGEPGSFFQYAITGATTDNAGWSQLAATYVTKGGAIADGDTLVVEFSRTGDKGLNGSNGTGTGDVVGPGLAVDSNIALFDTTTGKKIKDSGASVTGVIASAVAAALAPRNRVVNSMGYFAQAPLGSTADGAYTGSDQWYALTQSNPVTSGRLTAVEDGTPFMMRLTQANATSQRFGLAQPFEASAVADLRSKAVSMRFRARTSVATTLRWALVEWQGTADALTKDIVSDWTNATFTPGNFFISTTTAIVGQGSLALGANTLSDCISNAIGTVSSSMNNLVLFIWTDSAQAQNVTLDIGNVYFGAGNTAPTKFEPPSPDADLIVCRRYYYKLLGFYGVGASGYAAASAIADTVFTHPVQMRVAPSVTKGGTFTVNNCSQPSVPVTTNQTYLFRVTATATGAWAAVGADGTTYLEFSARL